MVSTPGRCQPRVIHGTGRVLSPVPTTRHGLLQSHILPGLQEAAYIFVRHDAHGGPLRPPYDGPFRVLEPGVRGGRGW